MAAMLAIGLAISTSSTTEMMIARNEMEAKKAFYLAESGVQEAIARMGLIGNARYIGEDGIQRISRIGGTPTYTGQTFTSSDLSTQAPNQLQNFKGTYSVTVNYARADGSSWCYGPNAPFNTCDNRVILFGQDYGFIGAYIPTVGYDAVYQIDSTGTTASGSTATIREYVTSNSLNVNPPADIFSNNGVIFGQPTVTGTVSGTSISGGCSAPCTSVPWPGSVDMAQYLGLPTAVLKQYATNMYNGGGTYNNTWGTLCNPNNTGNINDHICNNPGSLVYIDNAGSSVAALNGKGRGIVIITGDATITTGLTWEGIIYVMGKFTDFSGSGTPTVYGTVMVGGNATFSGNIVIIGSKAVAADVANAISFPRELRWARR